MTDDDLRSFFARGADIAAKITGNLVAASVGALIVGPPGMMLGAMAGPWIENGLQRLSGEFITRQLGERQLDRAAVGIVFLNSAVRKRVRDRQALRSEDFFRPDATLRSAADEVAEQAILAMIAAVDEKRIPFLANFWRLYTLQTHADFAR